MEATLAEQTVLICGAGGVSGRSLAELCLRSGARVVLSDRNAEADPGDYVTAALEASSDRVIDARPREDRNLLTDYAVDLVITGPGVPLVGDVFVAAREAAIPVRGENDFACEMIFQLCERAMLPAPLVVGVTGTDGKSTTVALIAHLVNQATGVRAIECGNFGLPLSQLALDAFPDEGPGNLPPVLVVECSSFQLELVQSFHPDVALILNIADDHLDRYPDRQAYLDAKLNIMNCQDERDVLLAPENILSQAAARIAAGRAGQRPPSGSGGRDTIRVQTGRPRLISVPTVRETPVPAMLTYRDRELLASSEFTLPGLHNQENLRFALLALQALEDASVHYLRGLHVNAARLADAIRSFRGLPHRMEVCRPDPDPDTITFLNDSKATTVQAVVAALASFTAPVQRVFLLCGGRAKGADFGDLGGRENVVLFPYGEAGPQIAERTGTNEVYAELESAFAAAVNLAFDYVKQEPAGEAIVLLSPGCASYDAYSSYHARGEHFRNLVAQWRP